MKIKGITCFSYAEADWQAIKCAFARTGKDADRMSRLGILSLRDLIEVAATLYLERTCDLNGYKRLKAESLAHIESVKAVRDQAKSLRDGISALPEHMIYATNMIFATNSTSMLDTIGAYADMLARVVDALENPGFLVDEDITSESNAALVEREYFWRRLIETWREFGGKESGDALAAFLFASTVPVVAAMPDGAKEKRRPLTPRAVERWLELRAKKLRAEKNPL